VFSKQFITATILIMLTGPAGAIENSEDSTPWKAYMQEDSFTGNKWCYVRTRFLEGSDGNYMRDIIIPTEQRATNKRGDFLDLNYNVSLGLMGTLKKDVQANIDNQMVDMDTDIEHAIESLRAGEVLKLRFQWSSASLGLKNIQETHTIKLDTFSNAWDEAVLMCK
jgi:hypothetical protein